MTLQFNNFSEKKSIDKVSIIGAGEWGIALASVLANNVDKVTLYSKSKELVSSINCNNSHPSYSKNLLPKNIKATNSYTDLIGSEFIVLATKAQLLRQSLIDFKNSDKFDKKYITGSHNDIFALPLVIASKGIENSTSLLMSEVIEELFPNHSNIAVISGPNFANEVLEKKLTVANLGCNNKESSQALIRAFNTDNFIVHHLNDIKGMQICGAAKNVFAIVSGLAHGMNLGANFQSAILAQSVIELRKLVMAVGGEENTVLSFAGIGDLFLTCSNLNSRNLEFGYKLMQGISVETLLSENTVEGYYTTNALQQLTKKLNIELPIVKLLFELLYEKSDPKEVLNIMQQILKIT